MKALQILSGKMVSHIKIGPQGPKLDTYKSYYSPTKNMTFTFLKSEPMDRF